MTIASKIDHTLLKADATISEIEQLCKEAVQFNFATVCVNPHYVSLCAEILKNEFSKVCTVIGFPLGANKTSVKIFEASQAINEGATEIDYVINICDVKNANIDAISKEMAEFVFLKENNPHLVIKIILEICYLTDQEISKVCILAKEAGIDYVKTSTGFGSSGATIEAINIMKQSVENSVKIKASGGVRTRKDAIQYLSLGIERIGTSNGISILENSTSKSEY